MTSLYDRIQTLGNRMATNLQKMGVSASFSDGGLTLADKILEINRFTDGIFISSDKSIGQSSDTIRLSALVLEDGNFKKNQAIVFQDENSEHQTIHPMDGTTDFKVLTNSNIFCGADVSLNFKDSTNRYWLNYNTGTGVARLYDTSIGGNEILSFSGGDHLISFNNGVFSSNGHSLDASQYFTSVKFYSVSQTSLSSVLVYYGILGYGVTGNDGVASIQYACSGAGLKEITATDGSVVSPPTSVIDALFYDPNWSDTSTFTNKYGNYGSPTMTPSSDGVTITNSGTGVQNQFCILKINGVQTGYIDRTKDYVVECDFKIISSSLNSIAIGGRGVSLQQLITDNNWHSIHMETRNGAVYISIDGGTETSQGNMNADSDISFGLGRDSSSMFKNIRVYYH